MILPIHALVRSRMAEAVGRLYGLPSDDPVLTAIPVEPAPRRALGDLAVPLAFELAYAHRCGITHGNVKAENVVLGCNGSVRLVRFQCNSHDSWRDIAGLGLVLQHMIAGSAVPPELQDIAAKAADSDGEHGYTRAAQVQNALIGLYSHDHSSRRAWKEIPGGVVTMAKSVLLYLLAFRNHP